MDKLSDLLAKRRAFLMNVIEYAETRLSRLACGRLRVARYRGKPQYFHITKPGDNHGTYIPQSNIKLVKALAQKNYYEKIVRAARDELRLIDQMMKPDAIKKFGKVEAMYSMLPDARKALVMPVWLDDEEYVRRWQAEPFEENPAFPEEKRYATKRGEYVRSKSEAMIADAYFDLGIPYKCDYPISINPATTKYVDFVLLDVAHRKEIYHEHFGLLDKPGYLMNNLHKLNEYRKKGIFVGKNLILTHDLENSPLDMNLFRKSIAEIFGKPLP